MIKKLLNIKARLGENPELKPIYKGMLNFYSGNKKTRDLAKQRYLDHCKTCVNFVDEPNTLLQVEDKKIPELSFKMCNFCGGCVTSYKLRQSEKKCEKWKK